jgi:CheY-like chemotaxis protein
MTPVVGRPIEILLVEDNPGDVRLLQETLKECRAPNNLVPVGDGLAAVAYVRAEGEYHGVARPDLILLDLNLPKKHGHEVLEEVKRDVELRRIPVIVLTTSRADKDILRSYDLHANCYITKPLGLDQFNQIVRAIEGFWLEIVSLPPEAL